MADPYLVAPDPDDPALTRAVTGIDHTGAEVTARVPVERPLTLFLNGQEIVTMMTMIVSARNSTIGGTGLRIAQAEMLRKPMVRQPRLILVGVVVALVVALVTGLTFCPGARNPPADWTTRSLPCSPPAIVTALSET